MAGNATVDEKLAESVRKFPILYDKSSKDFKDRHKKERAWEDVAKEVGFPSGKEAETAFRNLRNRYGRDKKKVKHAKVSGTGTDSVTDAKRETSELFLYLEWLEPYIQPRSSTSNLVVINDDSEVTADGTDKDDDCDRSSNSAEPDKVMFKSQVTGRTKYTKRNRAKDDVDSVELEFLQTIGERLKERPTQPQRDEESIFGDLIASQLRQLPYHERVMAKMEISNVVYSRLLRKNSTNPGYLAGVFPTQLEQSSHDMPQAYSQTNVREPTPPPAPSFPLTEMQSADNHVFHQGYFFQQLRQSEN